jgi:hypothetical protein
MQLIMVLLTVLLGLIVGLAYLWLAGPWKPKGRHSASEAGYNAPKVYGWGTKEGRHIR